MPRIALVTGANQGLGLAIVKGLCAALGRADVIYLTARSEERGLAARAGIGPVAPHLRFERLEIALAPAQQADRRLDDVR